ncbi:hypothetical protein LO772_25360 [Yinghuangia sp. ASG 101]|uniref:hypothetical protein n=1 Tax=Yinghuangia sp. ASG 101 TaxID=2896848 RepID=UPI001E3264A4|nr:hypothetical protein [Yinghuangia sp. ASG 101]UGQ10184.1 hypothetical protein LO772_25360 [Yinghuangia sp. ASG 101]
MPARRPAALPRGLVLGTDTAAAPYSGPASPPGRDDERFTFALISDRTGAARPGVFERGIAALNLLAPAFALQVGAPGTREPVIANLALDGILGPEGRPV